MQPDRDPVHLWDMLNAAPGVVASLRGLTLAQYAADENLRLATERRIEIIGEAARRISGGFIDKLAALLPPTPEDDRQG